MYDVLDVCRYIINYSNKKDYSITNLKLQKILYFIQSYYLVYTKNNEPCFLEDMEAWDFGPVVPIAYNEYKIFGSSDIPTIETYIEFKHNDIWSSERVLFDENIIQDKDKEIINELVDLLSSYSTSTLVTITHNQKPWIEARKNGRNAVITHESIRRYFNEQ